MASAVSVVTKITSCADLPYGVTMDFEPDNSSDLDGLTIADIVSGKY